MPLRIAKEGDRLVRLECRCGVVLVLESRADNWRCDSCRRYGERRGVVVLGRGGMVPAP